MSWTNVDAMLLDRTTTTLPRRNRRSILAFSMSLLVTMMDNSRMPRLIMTLLQLQQGVPMRPRPTPSSLSS